MKDRINDGDTWEWEEDAGTHLIDGVISIPKTFEGHREYANLVRFAPPMLEELKECLSRFLDADYDESVTQPLRDFIDLVEGVGDE